MQNYNLLIFLKNRLDAEKFAGDSSQVLILNILFMLTCVLISLLKQLYITKDILSSLL